jgi:phosphatidylserine synthase
MIDACSATIIVLSFILLFGVGVPILNIRFSKFVSYRWTVVVVVLALFIGALVNFSGLSDETRQIVIFGALIIAGGYIALRTIEKALANGWIGTQRIEAKFEKGDMKAGVEIDPGKK